MAVNRKLSINKSNEYLLEYIDEQSERHGGFSSYILHLVAMDKQQQSITQQMSQMQEQLKEINIRLSMIPQGSQIPQMPIPVPVSPTPTPMPTNEVKDVVVGVPVDYDDDDF